MKTTAERLHKRNPHSHSHRVKPVQKSHARQPGLSGENEFLPEPSRTTGLRPPRKKAAPEFLKTE